MKNVELLKINTSDLIVGGSAPRLGNAARKEGGKTTQVKRLSEPTAAIAADQELPDRRLGPAEATPTAAKGRMPATGTLALAAATAAGPLNRARAALNRTFILPGQQPDRLC
jgi:hypothetical protein